MNNDSPRYLAIGKIDVDDAFLDQVAWGRLRAAQPLATAPTGATPTAGTITPQMRDEARAFIQEYFLSK